MMFASNELNNGPQKRFFWLWILFGLLWAFYYLAVLLKTGYISDDAYNSQVRGTTILKGVSIWEFTWGECMAWIKGAGRFMPLAFYSYPLFYYLDSLFAYKFLAICVSLTNVGLFSTLLFLITKSRPVAILALFTIPVFFQLRAWHDPLLAFAFLVPLVGIHLFTSLIYFWKYLDNEKWSLRLLSLFFWACALLTYEMSYLCIVCFFFMVYARERRFFPAIKKMLPHLGVWMVIVATSILLRTKLNPYYTNTYPGATLHFGAKVWQTFLIQAYAAFPLSYYFKVKTHVRQYIGNFDILILIAFLTVNFYCLRAICDRIPSRLIFILGLFLVIAPAGVMGMSGYQDLLMEAGFGMGYIAVYLQYFGMCAVILGLFLALFNRLKQGHLRNLSAFVFCGFLTWSAFINLGQIRAVALESNKMHLYPRQVLDQALRDGFLRDFPEGATLLRRELYPQDNLWNYAKLVGRKQSISEPEPFLAALLKDNAADKNNLIIKDLSSEQIYALGYAFDGIQGLDGIVYLARVGNVAFDVKAKKIIHLGAIEFTLYDYRTRKISTRQVPVGKSMDFKGYLDRSVPMTYSLEKFEVVTE